MDKKIVSEFLELYNFRLFFCTTDEQVVNLVRKDCPGYESIMENPHGKSVAWSDGKQNKVCIFADSPATLAHECFHATMQIFDRIGETPNNQHDEPAAYLIGYLFKRYVRALHPDSEKWR